MPTFSEKTALKIRILALLSENVEAMVIWLGAWLALVPVVSGGFGGLRNQGNTCYLNSLLQTLYHCEPFREGILEVTDPPPKKRRFLGLIPLPGGRRELSTKVALKRVFQRLDKNQTAETKFLTRALDVDPLEQQDAQEYLRLLLETIDDVSAYEGELGSYLRVTDEEAAMIGEVIESKRKEKFLDLSLDLHGTTTIQAGLASFFAPELLTGELQWRTKDFGKRDAFKGYTIEKLPPYLVLHLKRFAYDLKKNDILKLHHSVSFPMVLEMEDVFLNNNNNNNNNNKASSSESSKSYKLHAVVCHVGTGTDNGHYYAFVDPHCDGRWHRFDDAKVTRVPEATVFKEGIGGAYLLQYKLT